MVLEGGCLNRDAELKVKVLAETKASPESGGILCASSKIWKTLKGSFGSPAVLAQQHDQKKSLICCCGLTSTPRTALANTQRLIPAGVKTSHTGY